MTAESELLRQFLSGPPLSVPRHAQVGDVARLAGEPAGGPLDAWLTGTGTPVVVPDRAGPSNVVRCGQQTVVVDCGNGVLYQLARLGITPREITHVFITHHHVDHNADLGYLLVAPWSLKGEHRPPVVLGPPGTYEYTRRVLAAQDFDLRARLPHGFRPELAAPAVVELADGDVVEGDGLRVTAFSVDHTPVDPAMGYRFDTDEMSLAFSGDTKPSDNLVRYARGVDVLVHEVLYPGFGFPDYHTVSTDVGAVATRTGAGHLVLSHLIPGTRPDEDWLAHARTNYDGPVTVGFDLMPLAQAGQTLSDDKEPG